MHLPLKMLGDREAHLGSTENISAAGVYLWVDGGLEVGSAADFEITIPREVIGAGSDVRLRCHGRVVRCDNPQEPGRAGVACVIERYEFLRADQVGGE